MSRILRRLAATTGLPGLIALALAAGVQVVPTGPAYADPVVTSSKTPQGGGLVRHDVSVDFQDGLARSGFIQITFASNFDASSSFSLGNWPDIQQVTTDPTVYHLQGGTGGGSQVDVVGIAQLVVPQGLGITYNAVVSRNGQNFVLVPEPNSSWAAGLSLVVVTALRARRRGRRDA